MVKGRTQSREGASLSSHDTKNPTGRVIMGHVIEPPNPVDAYSFSKSFGVHLLPDYGPVCSVKRPVRTRMRGVVGAGGEIPPATRLNKAATRQKIQNCVYSMECSTGTLQNHNNFRKGVYHETVRSKSL